LTSDQRIQPNTYYRVAVAAVNSIGEGKRSDKISVRTDKQYQAPSEPLNLEEVSQSGSTVNIQFDEPNQDGGADITHYKVYYSKLDERSGDYDEAEVLRTETTQVDLEQLLLQSTYRITVTASNSVGEGEHSEELEI